MKPTTKNQITLLGILFFLSLIFIKNAIVKESILYGANLWFTKVFPSLFPMFILSKLLIYYHFPEYLANIFGKYFIKIFHTTSYGVFVFIMSLLSGTPSSAYILKDLVTKQKITEKEASNLISFTFFSNPLFLLTMLSFLFPDNLSLIIKIILIHYGTNLLIGLIVRPKEKTHWQSLKISKETIDFGSSLSNALKDSLNTLIMILGTICFYLMISKIFLLSNPLTNNLWSGLLELTQGLNQLNSLNMSLKGKELLALLFINFGGLSIHTQIKSIISDTNISYFEFLKGRIFHVLIGTAIALIT